MIQKFLKLPTYILFIIVSVVIVLAYSNHFNNGFQLDDVHTISKNNAIRNFDIVSYFADVETFSAYTAHQSYRPITTLENAIDYSIAGELSPIPFHVHILLIFIATCLLIYFLVYNILNKHFDNSHHYNKVFSLAIALFFGLAKVNSEAVNYIIQRAEITSGFFILLGLLAYIKGGIWKSKYLYLIFPLLGFMSKEMGFVFAPLLFMYILLFEENLQPKHIVNKKELRKIFNTIKKVLPVIIITIAYYFFYKYMSKWSHGSQEAYKYFITQPMVILYYLYSYFFPFNLSTIPDWKLYDSIFYYKSAIGFLLLLVLVLIIIITSFKKKTKLIAFGLVWFLISLLPTSSIIPFAEVANTHRPFIPYIGLTIAFFSSLDVLRKYLIKRFSKTLITNISFTFFLLLILGNAYGTFQRNKVWNNFDSLWLEMIKDNPNNITAINNASIIHMKNARYDVAKKLLIDNLKVNPYYATFYINLGIIYNLEKNLVEAEKNFKKAITLKQKLYENPEAYFFYGKFLLEHNRIIEAIEKFEITLQKSPVGFPYKNSEELLMECYRKTENWEKLNQLAQKSNNQKLKDYYLPISTLKKSIFNTELEKIDNNPDKEKYLNLSLKYINLKKYNEAIIAAEKAIALDAKYSHAYNNIGFANFSLNKFDKAIIAYETAINLNPNYKLAINNLNFTKAYKEAEKGNNPEKLSPYLKATDYITISLVNYRNGDFNACIINNKKAIRIQPSSIAYNNICSAYNQLKEYKKAEEACNKAIKLNPNNNFAKNNLKIAIQNQ